MSTKQFNELLHRALRGELKALKQWHQSVSTHLIPQKNVKDALSLIEPLLSQPQHNQFANALFLRACMHEYGQGSAVDCLAASKLYKQARSLGHPLSLEMGLDDLDDLREFNSFFKKIKTNNEIKDIVYAINQMKYYGMILNGQSIPKGKIVEQHAERLLREFEFFILCSCKEEASPKKIEQFKTYFNQILHEQDELMSTHRTQWQAIIVNIAIALSGIGAIALLIKIASNWFNDVPLTFNKNCFFAQTHSQQLNDEINPFIQALSTDTFTIKK